MGEDKKFLIKAVASFCGGFILGAGGTALYLNHKHKKFLKVCKEIDEAPIPVLKKNTAQDAYKEIVKEYATEEALAEAEFPTDDLTEEEIEDLKDAEQMNRYREENKGKIEMITEDLYIGDFPEEDYYAFELWYFPEQDLLTNEDGEIIEPKSDYVGNIFEKTRFRDNDWEFIYIRNHPKEEKYKIHKESGTREDFFYMENFED